MAERRSKVVNKMVGPWALPGMVFIADTITADDGNIVTVTFPAKTIISVIVSPFEDTDAAKVVSTASVTDETGTVTFTKTGDGTFSYLVIATEVETIAAEDITADTSYTPVQ